MKEYKTGEKESAESLKNYLEERGCKVKVRREENDPPDFWFTIDGKEFPVEVVSITHQFEEVLRDRFFAFVNEVNKKANPRGTYIISGIQYPSIPKDGSSKWNRLVRSVVSFINSNREEAVFEKSRNGSLKCMKTSSEGSAVYPGLIISKFPLGEFQEFVKKRINQKSESKGLQEAVRVSGSKAILVIYDNYRYCSYKDDIKRAVLRVRSHKFHSIFYVFSSAVGDSEMFYSENDKWMPEVAP